MAISIHALHTEGDRLRGNWLRREGIFQSTPSIRRATVDLRPDLGDAEISIHALHTEGDGLAEYYSANLSQFQSTPSIRRATSHHLLADPMSLFQSTPSIRRATTPKADRSGVHSISIHALHTEGDLLGAGVVRSHRYFNPRPPYGGRPKQRTARGEGRYFNPRPPYGGRLVFSQTIW